MCNLYKMTRTHDEVAKFFSAIAQDFAVAPPGNAGEEVYPGYPGLVMDGASLRQMTWGFPLARIGARGQPLKPKPVNNARADKLASPFWSASFRDRRCLIPVSAWAEAQGPRGAMTRTWLSLPDQPLMALAGLWRDTFEWGPAYSMVMTESVGDASMVHARMPVIVAQEDWNEWLNGEPAAAFSLCRGWNGPLSVDQTDHKWFNRA